MRIPQTVPRPPPIRREWRNWGRTQVCVPEHRLTAFSVDEVQTAVAAATAAGQRVKAVGSGHSFTAAACTSGVMVSVDGLNDLFDVDLENYRVTVGAGIGLHALNKHLADVGMALANLGDIDTQTLAGATSTGTHGTGLLLPNLSTFIVGMEIMTASGEVIWCDQRNQPELLRMARVGLGALGIITRITLQCVPAFNLHAVETVEVLDDVLDGFVDLMTSHDHAEFFWMPGTRRCQVKRNNRTDRAAEPPSRAEYIKDKWIAENVAFGAVCRVGRRFPMLAPKIAKVIGGAVAERELVDRSDRVFCSPRHVRFAEMEYGMPVEVLPQAFRRIRDHVRSLGSPILFPIECRVSAADDSPLSTGYGRTSAWIAVHQYQGTPFESYFVGVERILADYDARPHWGKLHFQDHRTLKPLYPEWDAFAEMRAKLDPNGTFANAYTDRVLGPV